MPRYAWRLPHSLFSRARRLAPLALLVALLLAAASSLPERGPIGRASAQGADAAARAPGAAAALAPTCSRAWIEDLQPASTGMPADLHAGADGEPTEAFIGFQPLRGPGAPDEGPPAEGDADGGLARIELGPLASPAQTEPDAAMGLQRPDDVYYSLYQRPQLSDVGVPDAWQTSFGGDDTVIAVISDGVDYEHPDLRSKIWRNREEIPDNGIDDDGNGYVDDVRGWDFGEDDSDPMPVLLGTRRSRTISVSNRGTMMAGIAAAETNNGKGIAGVSWGSRIMPLKTMFWYEGHGIEGLATWPRDVVESVCYAANNGANVILMGGFQLSDPSRQVDEVGLLQAAIRYAHDRGALVVAPAGQCGLPGTYGCPDAEIYGENPTILPAAFDHVLAVQSFDKGFQARATASSGPWVDLAAPGEGMVTTVNLENLIDGDEYEGIGVRHPNPDEFAAAHVAGAAAVIYSVNRSYSPLRIESQLCGTASREHGGPYEPVDRILRSELFGCGVMDLEDAVEQMPWEVRLDYEDRDQIIRSTAVEPRIRVTNRFLNEGRWDVLQDVPWIQDIIVQQGTGVPSSVDLTVDLDLLTASLGPLASGDEVTTQLRACPNQNPRNFLHDDERDCLPGSRSGCHCFDLTLHLAERIHRVYLPLGLGLE